MCFVKSGTGIACGLLLLTGCGRSAPPPAPAGKAATNAGPQLHLNRAQPKLPTIKLWVGKEELTVEVARAVTEVATGMMYRTNLAENEGMLFVFSRPHRPGFYMRNTTVPLSCAYLDPEGAIVELHDLKPLDETPVEAGTGNIQYVLEVPQGWFQRHQVGPGAVITTTQGSFREMNWATLKPRRTVTP